MAKRIIRKIDLTEAEKCVLTQAVELLKEISNELDGDYLTDYENSKFITNIINVEFNY